MYNNNIHRAVARYPCGELRARPGQQAGVARGRGSAAPQVGRNKAWKLLAVKKLLYKSEQLGENTKNNARSFNHRYLFR